MSEANLLMDDAQKSGARDETLRVAMWSGPRNLSTALMRSFSQRPDCAVVDEPFYAAYLAKTGLDHPMRSEILEGERDAQRVGDALTAAEFPGKTVYYQKHMLQHMIEGMPRDWMKSVKHVFLIRDPARVIASYSVKREAPTMADLGFVQQRELFEAAHDPIVVEAADIRRAPEAVLSALCEALGIAFTPAMLSWPKGSHPSDGVWGQHWYGAIWNSTGFANEETSVRPDIDRPDLMGPAMEIYEEMHAVRLTG